MEYVAGVEKAISMIGGEAGYCCHLPWPMHISLWTLGTGFCNKGHEFLP